MHIMRRLVLTTVLAAGVCSGVDRASAAGAAPFAPASLDTIYLAITPSDTTVAPGSVFDLHLRVTQVGKGFNAYDAIVAFDPGALTFIQRVPLSAQEGSYMRPPVPPQTPAPDSACGNTFHRFAAGGDSLTINHSLLCQGVSLPGPGLLYNLRFQASSTPQLCTVRIRWIEFYDAGLYARPVKITNARVQDGPPSDAAPPPDAHGLRLQVSPNPFNPTTVIQLDGSGTGWSDVVVRDVAGRLVRTLARGSAGQQRWVWDGHNDRGEPVAAGVYLVSVQRGPERASARAVLLK
jgi:hypothetical protein